MDSGVAWTWRSAVNRERWEKIKDLFGSTVELDPSQRSAFLRDACGSDDALRAEVESLLASYQRTEALDEHQPPQPYGEKLVGQRLGAYKVLHEMGQGGMAPRGTNAYLCTGYNTPIYSSSAPVGCSVLYTR